jgi:hypothetical protein
MLHLLRCTANDLGRVDHCFDARLIVARLIEAAIARPLAALPVLDAVSSSTRCDVAVEYRSPTAWR